LLCWRPCEWITAAGDWVNDRTHGQQFKAQFLKTSAPTSVEGIEKYPASGMIRGWALHATDRLTGIGAASPGRAAYVKRSGRSRGRLLPLPAPAEQT
jgi:hypothetical protein